MAPPQPAFFPNERAAGSCPLAMAPPIQLPWRLLLFLHHGHPLLHLSTSSASSSRLAAHPLPSSREEAEHHLMVPLLLPSPLCLLSPSASSKQQPRRPHSLPSLNHPWRLLHALLPLFHAQAAVAAVHFGRSLLDSPTAPTNSNPSSLPLFVLHLHHHQRHPLHLIQHLPVTIIVVTGVSIRLCA
ncbi:hypothetical protein U9M48_036192 [Paspalum notatum var. saurae]|uniref:Uncharacterized protein n=1 Tax=Paspalum notatum var. saurae TaxID=547442 RepID=A0AAQ3UCP6_PASNO